MAITDMPNMPPSMPAIVMVAQTNSSQQIVTQSEHVLGICGVVNLLGFGQAELNPSGYAYDYSMINGDNKKLLDLAAAAKISIIQQPMHGHLEPDLSGDWDYAKYRPNDGYLGKDSFVIQMEANGYKVKLHYFMAVTDDFGVTTNPNPICKGEKGRSYWKISSTLDANGTLNVALNSWH